MPISQDFEEKIILINGLGVNYKISGQGQPFFILHGWGGSSVSWIEVQKKLAEQGFKVIVPDFPGFGKSKTPKEPWEVDSYVLWLKNFIAEMNTSGPFYLLGHSFGGRIAIKFSAKYPEKIKALILCSSAGIKPKQSLKRKALFYFARIGDYLFSQKPLRKFKNGARNVLYQAIRQKDYFKAKGTMRDTIKNILAEDLVDCLPKIKAKALIIWGKEDRMVPIKYAYITEEKIPNSKLIILSKIGHSPHLENPEKLAKEILQFINL